MNLTIVEINLLSGAFTAPFIDCLFDSTGTIGSATTLYSIIKIMHQHSLDCECVQLLRLLSIAVGTSFPNEIRELSADTALAARFISEHLKDVEDLLYDLL
jgi:hypothetical protein